ncbi:MAG: response regulator transcription factor [Phycisphaeraceae bacterium]|nr:response regulator transcription factor [Phycisphaeraceae bacterium]
MSGPRTSAVGASLVCLIDRPGGCADVRSMGEAAKSCATAAGNTIRLDAAELLRLLQDLDRDERVNAKATREYQRFPFRRLSVQVDMTQPGGQPTRLRYATRNLSNRGIGLLHSAYVHLGTPCVVHLPLIGGGVAPVPGKVIRCRHVRGQIHEVGVQFDGSINPRECVPLDPIHGNFTLENFDPARLTGSVLHVDESSIDRKLIRHYLRETGLNVVGVGTAAEALARCDEAFDVILCADALPDAPGLSLVEQLRAHGVQTPVIMLVAERSAASAAAAQEAKASATLVKPFGQLDLHRALAEFLLADTGGRDVGGAVYSTLRPEDETYGFVPEFLEELRRTAGGLSKAIADGDADTARRLCFQIRGSAPSLGFQVIAAAAEAALSALSEHGVADAGKQLRTLVFTCMRARVREEKPAAATVDSSPTVVPVKKAG